MMAKYIFSIVMVVVLTSCGGFRGGIESVPYVGEATPQEHSSHPSWPHEIVLQEFTLQLSLNNAVRTYQYELMLYVIPTYLNFWGEFRNREAESLELSLQLTALDSSMVIDPRQLVLAVEGREVRPSSVWGNNRERERQVIDAFVKAREQAPSNQPRMIPRSSEWRDAVIDPVALRPGSQSPRFVVNFPLPLLSPEKNLALNINHAILEPRVHTFHSSISNSCPGPRGIVNRRFRKSTLLSAHGRYA